MTFIKCVINGNVYDIPHHDTASTMAATATDASSAAATAATAAAAAPGIADAKLNDDTIIVVNQEFQVSHIGMLHIL